MGLVSLLTWSIHSLLKWQTYLHPSLIPKVWAVGIIGPKMFMGYYPPTWEWETMGSSISFACVRPRHETPHGRTSSQQTVINSYTNHFKTLSPYSPASKIKLCVLEIKLVYHAINWLYCWIFNTNITHFSKELDLVRVVSYPYDSWPFMMTLGNGVTWPISEERSCMEISN